MDKANDLEAHSSFVDFLNTSSKPVAAVNSHPVLNAREFRVHNAIFAYRHLVAFLDLKGFFVTVVLSLLQFWGALSAS